MNDTLSPYSAFHLTGERTSKDLDDSGRLVFRPALFGAYQDLPKLRHDFPLVLVVDDDGGAFARSLSSICDGVLREIAPRGIEGEALRRHVLRIEREIRALAHAGHEGSLLELWDLAETNLLARAGDAEGGSLGDSLGRARAALPASGEVVDCAEDMPVRVLAHAWAQAQEKKAGKFLDDVDGLVLKLSNILKADALRSKETWSADTLKHSVGSVFEEAFDFEEMSGIVSSALVNGALPERRRRRIRSVLSTLESQRFYAAPNGPAKKGRRKDVHAFVFDRCARALEAFQERLPGMVKLIKAISIAELEIENRYRDSTHDPFFRRFDESHVDAGDLALFPTYLACVRDGPELLSEKGKLDQILSSGLPIKVLVESGDILHEAPLGCGRLSFGDSGSRLAAMALGLTGAFVLQCAGSGLYRLREQIQDGMACNGPALFSVFSGSAGNSPGAARNTPDPPPYLRAAAAMESRAFPAFVLDPARGGDWASRFTICTNPQVETDWPSHSFSFEDGELQRTSLDMAFTFVDFVASDSRYAGSFAVVPSSEWDDGMVPVNEFLDLDAEAAAGKVPYILVIDDNNSLHRAVVEDKLIRAARRCRDMWRNLQELGGINNSHARKLLAREKEIWEEEKERQPAVPGLLPAGEAPVPPVPEEETAAAVESAAAEMAEEAAPPSDEPYIETPRCTTCNECTEINNKMFVYDDNQQAIIADANAGTYRQLVEAAETCQVAIIHPGKPGNPDEPDLDDLMARAEPFN